MSSDSGERLLALDLGTSACKLAVVDRAGMVLATASAAYPTRSAPGGVAEQDPADWLRALAEAVKGLDAAGHLGHLTCIALTGQMSAMLAVGRDGEALAPCLIWSDQRAAAEAGALAATVGVAEYHRLAGNPVGPTYTATKAMWLKAHRPELYRRTAHFLQPKDYLLLHLTGTAAIDPSDASCTGWLDITSGQWSAHLLAASGIAREKLPDIARSATVIGRIHAGGASASGLPAGLPVVLGGGDGPVSALGAGLVRAGQSYLSLGTSAWLSFITDRPVADQRLFNLRHVADDAVAVTGSTQNAANVLGWLDAVLDSADGLDAALDTVAPGADGLLCLPYLNGERTPYWSATASGVFAGLRPYHRPAHLKRAMAEGICHHLRLIVDTFAESGLTSERVIAIGGLTSSAAFMQLLAATVGRPLLAVESGAHATSIGVAMIGAVATGLAPSLAALAAWVEHRPPIMPEPDLSAHIARNMGLFRQLYAALEPLSRANAWRS